MANEQHRMTLPPLLMRVIGTTLKDEELSPEHRFAAVVLIVMGYGLWDQMASVDPTSVAIPNDEWKQIGEWLLNMPGQPRGSDMDRVNWVLEWMNRGPSGYEPQVIQVRSDG